MIDILVKPEQLRQTARNLTDSARKIRAALEAVDSAIRELGPSRFEGRRAAELRARHQRLYEDLLHAHKRILLLARRLEEVADGMEEVDLSLAGDRLFRQGKGDSTAVHPSDVAQGAIGDCYFMASLAALANTHPEMIRQMITRNPDGSYTVRFFNEKTGKAEYVTVRAEDIPLNSKGEPRYAQFGDDGELWPAVIEKAYAKWIDDRNIRDPLWSRLFETLGFEGKNDYELISGGWPQVAMQQLTGGASTCYEPPNTFNKELLQNSLKNGDLITIGTLLNNNPALIGNPLYFGKEAILVPSHAYYITGYDSQTGMVEVRNPWGWDHQQGLVRLPLDQLLNNITLVAVNSVPV